MKQAPISNILLSLYYSSSVIPSDSVLLALFQSGNLLMAECLRILAEIDGLGSDFGCYGYSIYDIHVNIMCFVSFLYLHAHITA